MIPGAFPSSPPLERWQSARELRRQIDASWQTLAQQLQAIHQVDSAAFEDELVTLRGQLVLLWQARQHAARLTQPGHGA